MLYDISHIDKFAVDIIAFFSSGHQVGSSEGHSCGLVTYRRFETLL
jgi:hypothetical protein